jgi:cell wall-associated NlpC family hydrolase
MRPIRPLAGIVLASLALALLAAASAGAQQPGPRGPRGDRDEPHRQPSDSWSQPPAVPAPRVVPTPPTVPPPPVVPAVPPVPAAPIPPAQPPPSTSTFPPATPFEPALPTTTAKTIAGRTAMFRTDGRAAIPRGAPKLVRQIIRMANQIVGKPYKWGGGHVGLGDSGYDCSGAVSYALIKAGLQRSSMVSGEIAHAYVRGAGRYVTIYANSKHVYMEVAGLRFDTSPYGDPLRRDGVRWRPPIGRREGFALRHPLGI